MLGPGVLVVGYGNQLRGDDGAGPEVAALLREDFEAAGAKVISAHQLTPELAVDVAEHEMVVFVDAASDGGPAGTVSLEPLEAPQGQLAGSFWHFVSPCALLALARDLYGATPAAFLVSVAVESTDDGVGLSPRVSQAVPVAAQAVLSALQGEPARSC
jgi:hydrogenase maturation protease